MGQQMGLLSGDTILAINNEPVDIRNIATVLKKNIDKDIALAITREHEKMTKTAHCPADSCVL
ncbi:MAG: hypothetical protein WCH65_08165 [bacterium]